MMKTTYVQGLDSVIAAESEICRIDGDNGKLFYKGYSIEELAQYSSFEETTYLLLYETLPTQQALSEFTQHMRQFRDLPPIVRAMIRDFPSTGSPMEMLQSVVSYLSSSVTHQIQHSASCNCRETLHQIAQMSTVIAAYHRFREGKHYIGANPTLSQGANFLFQLTGKEPTPMEGHIFDVCLILHAEHGFNASTFTARVVASTFSTCYSSISAAIGALGGFLHGGANERVMDMVEDIGSIENIDSWLDQALAEKRKVMGMGHRVYKTKDPRAVIMEKLLLDLCRERRDSTLYDFLKQVEKKFRERMVEEDKPIYPNVDFFSGAVYTLLGIPKDLFTPIFAAARCAGWLAHILEQRKDNRLYRPISLYVGSEPRAYVPMDERAS